MLETIREFGTERLVASGEEVATRRALTASFVTLAETASSLLLGPEQATWLGRLDAEEDNLRAALDWAIAWQDGEAALRLASALWRFWSVRAPRRDGRARLERALAVAGDTVASEMRARALNNLGNLAIDLGDYARARETYEARLALSRALGDAGGVANTLLNNLGLLAAAQGDYDRAEALYRRALAVRQAMGDTDGVAACHNNLGELARNRGDLATARQHFDESLARYGAVGDKGGVGLVLYYLGGVEYAAGDIARAAALTGEALTVRRAIGDRRGVAECLEGLGSVTAPLRRHRAAMVSH